MRRGVNRLDVHPVMLVRPRGGNGNTEMDCRCLHLEGFFQGIPGTTSNFPPTC
jgi:hypothetical protein